MPMYSLEYSDNYCVASGILWNYHRHKVISNANEIFANYNMINSNATSSRSFEYKIKTIGRLRSQLKDLL